MSQRSLLPQIRKLQGDPVPAIKTQAIAELLIASNLKANSTDFTHPVWSATAYLQEVWIKQFVTPEVDVQNLIN